ncbi:hypothetical protein DERF_000333 [Dermatophagoides farinae]|uniref:Uncharacterized protein n=1 Tax=Dermatophagoides farinae TaxID=6954 RepID=A0A922ICM3_DERFA|nr:hypothetical protein DERF_000333 [Dermatophagoides farinae]
MINFSSQDLVTNRSPNHCTESIFHRRIPESFDADSNNDGSRGQILRSLMAAPWPYRVFDSHCRRTSMIRITPRSPPTHRYG